MKKSLYLVPFVVLLFLFSLNSVLAGVEVFSNYDTILNVNSDNTIGVNKTLTLKNIYDVGIVPGQIEFKVGKGTEGSIGNIEIRDIKAVDSFGNEIKSQLRVTKDYSVIILDVYYPLLPGFEYTFNLYYLMSYEPGGIFFKSLQIPLRESTIPIKSGEFKVVLPSNYYFTYSNLDGTNVSSSFVNDNIAVWKIKDDFPKSIIFEYSYLPVGFSDYKGSYVFWISINVILLLILISEIRKEIKRLREEYTEK